MSPQPQQDSDPATEIECEIDDLIEEHGSERAAMRALLHDLAEMARDGDRVASRGYLRGLFSHGRRPPAVDSES